jgi:hypothetical protein
MTVGKVYQVTVETTAYTSGSLKTDSLSGTNVVSNGLGTITFVGVASSTALVIVRNSSNVDITIDNFSVREIDPLAVSIQMEGRMTYADTDTAFEVVPYSWYLNSSNQILQYTRTDLASPIMQFRQYANGVSDVVTSPSVNTGILVPFNIASRHGSTFINGAVSGTALTEDTTPTALPDLSATDLELGYDFMGTIKTFRIWAADLGDTGIAEASS